ncbi:type I restriction-modification system subunit M [Mycoplasma tullyi]|uniref:site-specific DNA-methyltransferase (adenine-specific) n=1 Tax=Mycoplasma tullyi TaxID=1612150 RepID=A0A7D7U8U0_9MOLU|nr:type I restriction-modification system subunit M [Mycoplasma tullyi]QMT98307.1 type I restriction-modification system subunit M [Mycoplasma tullyi]
MENKKELERKSLLQKIWAIANAVRCRFEVPILRNYILGFLFYRFLSENITRKINANMKKWNEEFDFSTSDESQLPKELFENARENVGYYISPNNLFCNVAKNSSTNKNLNIDLKKIFEDIEISTKGLDSEEDFRGLFDNLNFNDNRWGKTPDDKSKNISNALIKISEIDFGNYWDNSIDAFGDAYEYLMTMYAKNAAQSDGEFFTPQEVSELLAKITLIDFNNLSENHIYKQRVDRVYDPTCGSGSLLLKFAKILPKEEGEVKVRFYGQELNISTFNLARMNMFLHDIPYDNFRIASGDTLKDPDPVIDQYKGKYDAIVANPPFSEPWEGEDNPTLANDPRFTPAGVLAPKGYADWAFTMHILSYLAETGTAAVVNFPGALSRPDVEVKIRKYFVENNYIDTIIQLPKDLFFSTKTDTCIIVLRKNRKDDKVLFVDASKLFIRIDAKNKLTKEHQEQILDVIINRKEIEYFSKLVSKQEIETKTRDWNLSVNKYVEKKSTKKIINIVELNKQIKETTLRVNELRTKIDQIVDELENE